MATKGYWKSGAVDSPPDTSTLTSKGYPTSGDPKTGTPATKPGAAWYYLQDQMRNTVIEAAGQTLAEPPSATQFLEALRTMKWLADNTIPGGKIANASITGAKLTAKTVAGGNLADLSVSTAKLAAGGVTKDKIAQGAVDGTRLATQSVAFSHLLPAIIATEGQVTEGTAKNVLMTPFLTKLMVQAFNPPAVPPGTIIHYAGRTVPSGWLICNGANVSRTDYAALFAAIGTIYGTGDGVTTFGLPNMGGRFLEGTTYTGSVGTYYSAGLPNITGYFSNNGDGRFENSSGSFTNNTSVTHSHSGNNANEGRGFDFSASKSSSFYGQSSTVKPPAMSALVLIKF